jgi:hypothetical protein
MASGPHFGQAHGTRSLILAQSEHDITELQVSKRGLGGTG